MEPLRCRVTVIINKNSQDLSFSIRYGIRDVRGQDEKTVSLKFVIQGPYQLDFVVSELEKFIALRRPCNVQFSLEKSHRDVQNNEEFKNKIRGIMYPILPETYNTPPPPELIGPSAVAAPTAVAAPAPSVPHYSVTDYINMDNVNLQRANRLIPTIANHTREYGAHPDLRATGTEKGRKKIHNYIKSASATPAMTMDEALYIASKITG